MFSRSQSNNQAGGDIVGGDKYVTNVNQSSAPTPLGILNEKYLAETANAKTITVLIEELQHYLGRATNPDIRDLSQKLQDANRLDLLHYAEDLKERIAKSIMRHQTSATAQDIISHILADIIRRFTLRVLPAIQEGAARREIDSLIDGHVIDPVFAALEKNVLHFKSEDILGMVFFLGGNCHLRWDKC